MSVRSIPCAIYTRKSTDEGLDQAFNSLDAQRAACSAYIRSQASEGWTEIKTLYDDGAQSGGTIERPALKRLLADVAAGRVKVIVVYKVDRLTRSLADFAKIIEILEAHDASFVSITQQFSTTTSMGRLTLNVLLSFAQFEREVTAERIRDKIAASKKKGMWMGGVIPLGYDVRDRKLLINEAEAKTVQTIFELYRKHTNTRLVKDAADRLGLRTKEFVLVTGRRKGGRPFTRGHINKILINRLYIGEITHKDMSYAGEHAPIIDRAHWDATQAQLTRNAVVRRTGSNAREPSLLTGLVKTGDGARLVPSHTSKGGQRYRYYITKSEETGGPRPWRLPAPALEKLVINGIDNFLLDRQRIAEAIGTEMPVDSMEPVFAQAAVMAADLRAPASAALREKLLHILQGSVIDQERLCITLNAEALHKRLGISDLTATKDIIITLPISLRRRGIEVRFVIENSGQPIKPDEKLIELVVQAHRWFNDLKTRPNVRLRELGKRDGADRGDISRILPLAFLAPDIVEAILNGRQPPELTAARLKRMPDLPLDWQQQRRYLGFE
ncbi:MAG TPA: recombinase family protein [Alphaproteobacteria bacterium]|jgi:DNA invertase Pin-like site-specific DNA recombinase